jgi:hypothetical protein
MLNTLFSHIYSTLRTGKSTHFSFIFFLTLSWDCLNYKWVYFLCRWKCYHFGPGLNSVASRPSKTFQWEYPSLGYRITRRDTGHHSLPMETNWQKWGGVQYEWKLCYWDTVVCSEITLLQWIYYCVTNSICLFSLFLFRMIQRSLRFNNDELGWMIKNELVVLSGGTEKIPKHFHPCNPTKFQNTRPQDWWTHTIQFHSFTIFIYVPKEWHAKNKLLITEETI